MTPLLLPVPVSASDGSSAARSLNMQLLCTQLTPLPPPSSYNAAPTSTATLPFRTTKKRKTADNLSDRPHLPPNKKVTSTVDAPSPPPYPIRSRLRRTNSNSSTSSTSSTTSSPSSPATPLSPVSPSRSELHAAVVQSFPSLRYCAYPLSLYRDTAKGYGVRSTTSIPRHSLVCEYAGELLTSPQSASREQQYAQDEQLGCYMFYFAWHGSDYCVDSTRVPPDDTTRLLLGYGRYINHSRVTANLYGRVVGVDGRPHLCFFAKRVIGVGEELLIDYGDRSRESRQAFPWLNH